MHLPSPLFCRAGGGRGHGAAATGHVARPQAACTRAPASGQEYDWARRAGIWAVGPHVCCAAGECRWLALACTGAVGAECRVQNVG